MEWVGKGIRVNSISPGYTATPMNTRPEMVHQTREFESQTPMQRMAKVEEMAGPALFLASDAASFCTGVDLGGRRRVCLLVILSCFRAPRCGAPLHPCR